MHTLGEVEEKKKKSGEREGIESDSEERIMNSVEEARGDLIF